MLRWVYDCVSFEWDVFMWFQLMCRYIVKPDNQVFDPLQCKCQIPNRNRLLLFTQSLTTTATCAVLPYFTRKFLRFAQSRAMSICYESTRQMGCWNVPLGCGLVIGNMQNVIKVNNLSTTVQIPRSVHDRKCFEKTPLKMHPSTRVQHMNPRFHINTP
jgi:hypothetical protein